MPEPRSSGRHRWRFFRAGGVDQVRIESGADIVNLKDLNQKLWVALSCPTKGLEFDEKTLKLLDTDNDGRVRALEILAACKWLAAVLKNADELIEEKDGVPLSSINDKTPEGRAVLDSAELVLESLGKTDEGVVTTADAAATEAIFKKAKLNGDGIIPPESVDDAAKQTALDIIECVGGEADRSGLKGVNDAKIEAFFKECEAFDAWRQKAEADKAAVLPLGDATAAAFDALSIVRVKVDDYFARCRLAAFDPRAQELLNGEEKRFLQLAAKDLTISAVEIQGFPLARIEAGRALDLKTGLNPAWCDAVAAFREKTVGPVLGKDKDKLTEDDWKALCAKFAAFGDWRAAKAGAAVEKLGVKRIREILAGKTKETLTKATAADRAAQSKVDGIAAVEKLTHLYRDFRHLLVNFVSFSDFYSRERESVFQAGTLYLDGRSCELCFRVDDAGKHGILAVMARTYLAYCDCSRPSGEKMTVACAFTAGDSDHLMVGRNGVFYDRKGRDWDATITKIIDNPISIGQAFWAPYKRALRWIEEQVAKRAAAADAEATNKLTTTASEAGEAAQTGVAAAPPKKLDIGILAAISVAIGGITTIIGSMLQAFFGLGYLMPLGLAGVVLLISGPSMLIAWLKLRERNLGPILDAGGWAVNGRVKINIPLGGSLTDRAVLPPGAERSLVDPFAETRSPWPRRILYLFIFAALLFGLWESKVLDKQSWYQDSLHYVSLDTKTEHAAKADAAKLKDAGAPAGPGEKK